MGTDKEFYFMFHRIDFVTGSRAPVGFWQVGEGIPASCVKTVRTQHVPDLEEYGTLWQVGTLDYYCLSSLRFCSSSSSMLFSASTDKTVAVWDSETGERVKRLKGHTSFVNSCYPARRGPQLVCTGSDDGTVKVGVVCVAFSQVA